MNINRRNTGKKNESVTAADRMQPEKGLTPGVEIKIIIAVIFLMAFGLIMIFSASSYTASISSDSHYDSAYYFKRQLVNIVISVVACIVAAIIYTKLSSDALKIIGLLAYFVSIILILLLLSPLGITSGGATRWLDFKFFQVQVADAVKVCMILFMAFYISKYWRKMNKPIKHLKKDWKVFLPTVGLWLLIFVQAILVLFISSNLSSAIILLLMVFVLTFIVGKNPTLHILVAAAAAVALTVLITYLKANMPLESELTDYPYQLQRVIGWLDPERYASSLGYQPLQSLYAIGSGGLLGKGLGNGTQKLGNIPEAQNDMIFSIICEELGIVGAILLFIMYGYLLYQMFVIVNESRGTFGSVVVIGVMLHIIFQIIVNVCVAVNFFPNTGVSLPFISYGGSATLFTLIEIGLVIGVRRKQYRRVQN